MKILIKNLLRIVTMDDDFTIHSNADILIEENQIKQIRKNINADADEIIDGTDKVAYPGLVNTHHHLYQTLTRAMRNAQNAELFDWLIYLYEIWRKIGSDGFYTSALVGLGELLLTGCTTSTDHLYLFPKNAPKTLIDEEIAAAKEIGIRFHPTRGSMSRGKSNGGLPPDDVVQPADEILKDSERLISKYHDTSKFSMLRIALAPCSPFSVTDDLMLETARLARDKKVKMHTHLAETLDEEEFCISTHGMRPLKYMEKLNWIGNDVWFAHCVYLNEDEIKLMGETGTGVAHCPSSNMRLGSGIAPIPLMMKYKVPVGLAVDGSASNDSSDMLGEVRQCLLLHRVLGGASSMKVKDALYLATRGGAKVLGRDDIGILAPGYAADLFLADLSTLPYAGSHHDPVAAPILCGASHIAHTTIVNGVVVVREGRLVNIDEKSVTKQANKISLQLNL